jgi:RES domain-containing protein
MVLWRISRHRDLSGMGGLRAGGRWHYAGQPVVYLTENPASALLEVCVHTAGNNIPPEFTLLRIEGPEIETPAIAESDLAEGWQTRFEISRSLGTEWLRKRAAVLLRLPSAIVPETTNFLFNPLHPDAGLFKITEALEYPLDRRIKR